MTNKKAILGFIEYTKNYSRDVKTGVWHTGWHYLVEDETLVSSKNEYTFTDDELVDDYLKQAKQQKP